MHHIATLLLRVSFGFTMAIAHGWPKLIGFSEHAAQFPDPYQISPILSMALATFAEFFCSILVALGVFTRFTAIPVVFTMGTAFFRIHAGQDWSHKEPAFLFCVAFLSLCFLGSGKFSLDHWFFKKI